MFSGGLDQFVSTVGGKRRLEEEEEEDGGGMAAASCSAIVLSEFAMANSNRGGPVGVLEGHWRGVEFGLEDA